MISKRTQRMVFGGIMAIGIGMLFLSYLGFSTSTSLSNYLPFGIILTIIGTVFFFVVYKKVELI